VADLLPDLGSLSDEELKQLNDDLEAQEQNLSYERRVLHGKLDILRAEIVARLQRAGGEGGPATSGVREPRRPRPSQGSAGAELAPLPEDEEPAGEQSAF
jgi:hypothetical protein